MPIVDTHCHASLAWYQPIETLIHEMDSNGVQYAVLIQIRGQYDNSYQFECLRRYPGRLASVVCVDWPREDAVAQLERLAEQGASGVRLVPGSRSPSNNPLAVWRAAERLRLPVSCLGTAADFVSAEFAQLVESLPGLTIVVEHLAGLGRATPPEVVDQALALSRFPNLYVKVPGLGEFCERGLPVREPFPFVEPIPPLLERFCEAFGPSRLMWGSDFPPVAGREGYRNALRFPMAQLAGVSDADRDAIFGGTALKVFAIRG